MKRTWLLELAGKCRTRAILSESVDPFLANGGRCGWYSPSSDEEDEYNVDDFCTEPFLDVPLPEEEESGVAANRGRRPPPLVGDGDREDEEEDDILRRLSLMWIVNSTWSACDSGGGRRCSCCRYSGWRRLRLDFDALRFSLGSKHKYKSFYVSVLPKWCLNNRVQVDGIHFVKLFWRLFPHVHVHVGAKTPTIGKWRLWKYDTPKKVECVFAHANTNHCALTAFIFVKVIESSVYYFSWQTSAHKIYYGAQ